MFDLRMYRPPKLLKSIFRNVTWEKKQYNKAVYLTFDDGPHPDVSPWLTDFLNKNRIHASFFFTGKNMKRWPGLVRERLTSSYIIGNHTYDHINGWRALSKTYKHNVKQWENVWFEVTGQTPVKVFRPPYGKITPSQMRLLRAAGYEIVMWSVLSYDFDRYLSAGCILKKLKKFTVPGSIIVFHETPGTIDKIRVILPEYVDFCRESGYCFQHIRAEG